MAMQPRPALLSSSTGNCGSSHSIKTSKSKIFMQNIEEEFTDMRAKVDELEEQIHLLLNDHKDLHGEVRQMSSFYKKAQAVEIANQAVARFKQAANVNVSHNQSPRKENTWLKRFKNALHFETSSPSAGEADDLQNSARSNGPVNSATSSQGSAKSQGPMNSSRSSQESATLLTAPRVMAAPEQLQRQLREQRRGKEREQLCAARLSVLVAEEQVEEVLGTRGEALGVIAKRTGTSLSLSRTALRPGYRSLTVEQQGVAGEVPSAVLQALSAANPHWNMQGGVAEVVVVLPSRLEEDLRGKLGRHIGQVAQQAGAGIRLRRPERSQTDNPNNHLEFIVKGTSTSVSRVLMSLEWVAQEGHCRDEFLRQAATDGVAASTRPELQLPMPEATAIALPPAMSFDTDTDSDVGGRSVGGSRRGFRSGNGGAEEEMLEAAERRLRYDEEQRSVARNLSEFGLTKEALVDNEKARIEAAKRARRGTVRGCILNYITSPYFQAFSFFCLVANLAVTWIEIDARAGSETKQTSQLVQFSLTTIFFLEAMLNLCVIPQSWKTKDLLIDAVVCIAAFVLEIVCFALDEEGQALSTVPLLLLLRMLRFGRLLRRIRHYRTFRAVRVILAGLSGTLMNLFWITITLLLIFYTGGIVFRTLLKPSTPWWSEEGQAFHEPTEMAALVDTYFPSVTISGVTLFEVFIEAFDHSSEITQPLLQSRNFVVVGYLWVIYLVFMKICVVNLVTGLFIEQLIRAAAKSDEAAEKERLAMQNLDYHTLLGVFRKMDNDSDGIITFADFEEALKNQDVDEVLHHAGPSGQWDARTYFQSLDVRGQGQLSFSDFVYGVVKQRCGIHSLDQLVFDHQVKTLVRQSSQTYTEVWDANAAVQNSAAKVETISQFLNNQRSRHSHEMKHIRGKLNILQKKIDSIFIGLDIRGGESYSQTQKSLVSVANVREAKQISEVMINLRTAMEQASEAASTQTKAASAFGERSLKRFREDLDQEVQKQMSIIRAEGAQAAAAASAAAIAAKASVATAQSRSPARPKINVAKEGTSFRRAFEAVFSKEETQA